MSENCEKIIQAERRGGEMQESRMAVWAKVRNRGVH